MKSFYSSLILWLTCIISLPSYGLDNHYWTNQFGSRSALMGGAVVGGVRDTSAGFYNPGALGFVEKFTFSVNANAYQLEWLSIDDGAGTGETLESQQPQVLPLLISGTFVLGNNVLGYSLLTKDISSMNMSARWEQQTDVHRDTDSLPPWGAVWEGNEDYRAQYLLNKESSEIWGGLSWASKVNEHLAVGTSGFVALRNQTLSEARYARAANLQTFVVSNEEVFNNYEFYNLRGLMKLGIAANFDTLKVGATLTTPSVNLFGKGTVAGGLVRNASYTGDFILDDRQEDLDTKYQTPLSVAVGLEYSFNYTQTRLAGTLEWFAKQTRYNIFTPAPKEMFLGSPDNPNRLINSQEFLKEEAATESIINFALALEQQFLYGIKGYVSVRSDLSAKDKQLGGIEWDIYHLTLGLVQQRERSEVAFGLTYGFGQQEDLPQLANLRPAMRSANDFLLSTYRKETQADYQSLGVIIGYTYYFE